MEIPTNKNRLVTPPATELGTASISGTVSAEPVGENSETPTNTSEVKLGSEGITTDVITAFANDADGRHTRDIAIELSKTDPKLAFEVLRMSVDKAKMASDRNGQEHFSHSVNEFKVALGSLGDLPREIAAGISRGSEMFEAASMALRSRLAEFNSIFEQYGPASNVVNRFSESAQQIDNASRRMSDNRY
jgi:hypothetical protein